MNINWVQGKQAYMHSIRHTNSHIHIQTPKHTQHTHRLLPALRARTHTAAMHDMVFFCSESGECHEAAAWSLEKDSQNRRMAAAAKERKIKAILAYKKAAAYSTAPGAVVSRDYAGYCWSNLGLAFRRIGQLLDVCMCFLCFYACMYVYIYNVWVQV
jgi:hypothetical protein